jgi:hypothetical protein
VTRVLALVFPCVLSFTIGAIVGEGHANHQHHEETMLRIERENCIRGGDRWNEGTIGGEEARWCEVSGDR